MMREEKEKRIEKLEWLRFELAMKDRWSEKDFDTDKKWADELFELKKELKNA